MSGEAKLRELAAKWRRLSANVNEVCFYVNCANELDAIAATALGAARREALSKWADEVNQCLQIIVTNAGNIKAHTEDDEKLAAKRI
jgi:hypothetical protein